VILGRAAALPFIIAGVAVLIRGGGGLYWVVPGTILSFLIALQNAWILLIEINR
jgi:hypothetical protein